MPSIFIDTSGWGCLVDDKQTHHRLAAVLYKAARQQKQGLVTTNYIVAELVALMTSPLRIPRPTIIAFVNSLKSSPYLEIIHVDNSLDNEAWRLLANRQDKEWSLVDCVSFELMWQRGMAEALTTDHNFEQAGFIRLLK